MKSSIIIIDDDTEDQEALSEVMLDLEVKHPVNIFSNCEDALQYLEQTDNPPFLIICDINIPGMNGMELKRQIELDESLKEKSIPFIFLSTASERKLIHQAYLKMNAQGYFQKPPIFSELKKMIRLIVDYWELCQHPRDGIGF